ncbi:MAG: chemotaxis protein CheA, partial [Syntrophomonadaceae bacterium]|nr:chemotaxis protein CheA [Syntrophomonadaceae bacterium]
MNKPFSREPMMEMFIFETVQLIEQLEQAILNSEKANCMEVSSINEIFRIMHTIKGSAAMMMLNNIASLTHSIEDLFYFFRENESIEMDNSRVCDIVLGSIDFIKEEVVKLENEQDVDGEPAQLIAGINEYLCLLKGSDFVLASESPASQPSNKPSNQKFYISADKTDLMPDADSCKFRAVIFFEHGCEMENIRAFNIVHQLKDLAESIDYFPEDIIENDTSIDYIRENGFVIIGSTFGKWEQIEDFFARTPFVKEIELKQVEQDDKLAQTKPAKQIFLEDFNEELPVNPIKKNLDEGPNLHSTRQSLISVNVNKLDKLMDLVGELVISEAMVTLNPDLANGLNLDNFSKAARQHRKIINELQDIVMSIRMVPLTITFQKMNRIVRDMSKKLNKEVLLEIIGEETEVDKNIIEHLSDPLMHLIRNAIDHGIESREERIAHGKSITGKIKLEAKNEGGDVWITVKDDGAGLSKEKILSRARTNGLISKPDNELTDREIYSTILLPGFSTREEVNEFSGRGVGMDVVSNNIEMVGGTLLVDSIEGVET